MRLKKPDIELRPLLAEDREQFILDNQRAFLYGATEEFGLLDQHYDDEGQIISRRTIERSIDSANARVYRIMEGERRVGGVVLQLAGERGDLDLFFVAPEAHSRGIGCMAWRMVEEMHPEIRVWETMTPYFEKRNIHFYVNRCGFHIVEFFNQAHSLAEYYLPEEEAGGSECNDEMFRFEKIMPRREARRDDNRVNNIDDNRVDNTVDK